MTQFVLATVKIEVPEGKNPESMVYETVNRLESEGYDLDDVHVDTRPLPVDFEGMTYGQPRVLTAQISIPVYGEHGDDEWEEWLLNELHSIDGAFIDSIHTRPMGENEEFY